MRYLLIVMLIVSVFFLRPPQVFALCSFTMTNCTTSDLDYCTYDGSSTWDKLFDAYQGCVDAGSTDDIEYGCDESSSCYIIAASAVSIWFCQDDDVSGSVDCDEYACVDSSSGSYTWYSGDSEYCCSDDTCTTDC